MSESPVLVVNAGSSSLKLEVIPKNLTVNVERIGGDAVISASFAEVDAPALETVEQALKFSLELLEDKGALSDLSAVGHRVVHGGEVYTEPTLITDDVLTKLDDLAHLAPLHNPANVAGIRAARSLLSSTLEVPHIAVFDTAFHSTLPPQAYLYGLPRRYAEQGIRVYGFHGTSHDYVTQEAAKVLGRARETLKLVSLHLGNGASAAAVCKGKSVDTTMGFTPLDGLLMGTRTGHLDPSVVLRLMEEKTLEDVETLLNKQSGLLGLSGVSNDMRDVRKAAEAGNTDAAQAIDVFCYRIRKVIGAYAAAMNGLDALVFTAGIGENDAETRAQCVAGLDWLGVELDDAKNRAGETVISTPESRVRVLVIPTDEAAMIARASLEITATEN